MWSVGGVHVCVVEYMWSVWYVQLCMRVHSVRVDVVTYVLCIGVWYMCRCGTCDRYVECVCTVHIWVELGVCGTCGCGHTSRTPVCHGLLCVPLCVNACPGQWV